MSNFNLRFLISAFLHLFIFTITFSFTTVLHAQESKTIVKDSLKTSGVKLPNSPQIEEGDIKFTDGSNDLLRITDEGNFGAIELKNGVPSTTTNKLYNDGGTLKFNGSSLGSGSGATEINDLSDAKSDGFSVFVGFQAGSNDYGQAFFNTGIGLNSLKDNITGQSNTAVGAYSLEKTTGYGNTALGYDAGNRSVSNSFNIFLGYRAGYYETTDNKLYIENSSSSTPLIWGDFSVDSIRINGGLHVTGNITSDGVSLGATELNELTDAKFDGSSLFMGQSSGLNDDAGASDGFPNVNLGIGISSLRDNITGAYNTAVGALAMRNNTAGNFNSAFGEASLFNNTLGDNNSAFGNRALSSNSEGVNNTAVGYRPLYSNTFGNNNIAVGSNALYQNTDGDGNVVIGVNADYNNIHSNNNTIIGFQAGQGNGSHSKSGNVLIGYKAGYYETGHNKLYIENSDISTPLIWGDFANDIATINGSLGVNTQSPTARVDIVAANSEDPFRVAIVGATKLKVHDNGGTSIGLNASGTPTNGLYVHGDLNYNAALTSVSDQRYKKNIKIIENPLENISKIRGVTYDWRKEEFPKRDFTTKKQIGVIAQEVESVFPELVSTNKEGYKSVDYVKLTPILLEAVKELSLKNSDLESRLEKLESFFVNQ